MSAGRTSITPDDVMQRYLGAKGWRDPGLQVQRDALRARIAEVGAGLQDYILWLERDLAYCLAEHGHPDGGER